jgi:maltose O-acetyltransferase
MYKRIRKYVLTFFLKIMPNMAFFKINRYILSLMGHEVAFSARVWSSIDILGTVKLRIGKDTFIGHRFTVSGDNCNVEIGDYCDISSNVSFVNGSHLIDLNGPRIAGEGFSLDIKVGNRVWIGYGSIVLGGIDIGDNVIIGAGSLVNKNIPSNTIYAGIPAKIIRDLTMNN